MQAPHETSHYRGHSPLKKSENSWKKRQETSHSQEQSCVTNYPKKCVQQTKLGEQHTVEQSTSHTDGEAVSKELANVAYRGTHITHRDNKDHQNYSVRSSRNQTDRHKFF